MQFGAALGRLMEVREESTGSAQGKTLASYSYRGERIGKTATSHQPARR